MAVQISGNDITVPRDGTFSRNVSIAGTLTYEDVTNIDSIGLVTARNGIEIGARPGVAASISVDGNMIVSGISTFGGALSGTTGTFSGAVAGTTGTFSSEITGTRANVLASSTPQIRINNDTGDGSGTRVMLGKATTDNNFVNGAASGDTVLSVPGKFIHGVGTAAKVTIESAGNVNVASNLKVVGVCTAASFESATFSKTPTNTPAFHAYYSGNTSPSLSNNTWTKVTFLTTETLDTDSAYDGSKFTVPSGKGGYYQVATSMNFYADNNDMKNARVAIYKNGSVAIQSYNHINNYAAGLRHLSVSQSGVLNLSASDYLEVYVNITTNGASAGYLSNDANGVRGNFFSAFKLII